jgi:hypothetical protein
VDVDVKGGRNGQDHPRGKGAFGGSRLCPTDQPQERRKGKRVPHGATPLNALASFAFFT